MEAVLFKVSILRDIICFIKRRIILVNIDLKSKQYDRRIVVIAIKVRFESQKLDGLKGV